MRSPAEQLAPLESIRRLLSTHTTKYHLYLRDLRTGAEHELGREEPYPICSCFKLAVLAAVFKRMRGAADLEEEVMIPPERFSPGGGVVNYLNSSVTFTIRQLTRMMMAFSDGTATDLLVNRTGLAAVNDELRSMAPSSSVTMDLRGMVERFRAITGSGRSVGDAGRDQVEAGCYSTARDLAALALRSSELVFPDPEITSPYHETLRTPQYAPRTSYFFKRDYTFVGKTGSFGFGYFMNDCGVIEHESRPIAVLGYTTQGWRLARTRPPPRTCKPRTAPAASRTAWSSRRLARWFP